MTQDIHTPTDNHAQTAAYTYVDTHCHLDSILTKANIVDYITLKQEFPPEFEKAIHIACSKESIDFACEIIQQPEVYTGIGIHPHDAKDYDDTLHQEIISLMANPKVLAWGEIGLDYHYDFSPREIQKTVFERQVIQAVEMEKPIIIHTREANEDTIEILTKHLNEETRVHIHCFTGTNDFAQQLLKLPGTIYFGFTGVITFRNADAIREALQNIPIELILLETDAPYMAPIPFRGKPAHPGHIPFIAAKIAEVKSLPIKEVFDLCRENTRNMYGI